MQPIQFFFASTPLNIMLACSIALSLRQGQSKQAVLILIDQTLNESDNPYFLAVKKWRYSPFKNVLILSLKQSKLLNKLTNRRRTLKTLKRLIKQYQPEQIFTGNDRRIEFQYAHHLMQKYAKDSVSTYYEDGLFSYLPRKAKWTEKWITTPVNYLYYGFWRETPESAGHSNKINQIYAAFPDLVCDTLKQKPCVKLPDNLTTEAMLNLATILLQISRDNVPIKQLNTSEIVVILPHESNYKHNANYRDALLKRLPDNAKSVLIKYHPRNTQTDALNLTKIDSIQLLNPLIPFEFYLPYFQQTKIIGDISAALLTSKWLRPDLEVFALEQPQNSQRANLYQKLGIQFLI